MNRRAALKSLAVVGSASVAGCSSIPFVGTSGVVLGKIEVINETFVSNRIRLIVAREDRPGKLLDRMISLAAYDSADSAHGTIIHPSWPKTEGKYRLIATHYDDSGEMESDSSKYTFTQADVDRYYDDYEEPDCLGALVKIGSRTDDTEKDTFFLERRYHNQSNIHGEPVLGSETRLAELDHRRQNTCDWTFTRCLQTDNNVSMRPTVRLTPPVRSLGVPNVRNRVRSRS